MTSWLTCSWIFANYVDFICVPGRLRKLEIITKDSPSHRLVRLCWRSAMLETLTWMSKRHGLYSSKVVPLQTLLQRLFSSRTHLSSRSWSRTRILDQLFLPTYKKPFSDNHLPWFSQQDLVLILEAMRIIAVALSPVTPCLSWRIYAQLGFSKDQFEAATWVCFSFHTCVFDISSFYY